MSKYKVPTFNDLGLGGKAASGRVRTLNKDGSFNIRKINIPFFERINIFHALISMSWLKFFSLIIIAYVITNSLFASAFVLIGVEHLTGVDAHTFGEEFAEAFFFSAQTLTTLGYGRVAPTGMAANTIAAMESMLGLLVFALATGLSYARFSNPTAKIKYSRHGLIAPYQDMNAFMFRIVNVRSSQLLEVEVNLTVSMLKANSDLRDFYTLELERKNVVLFPSVWTIVHPISETSPLNNLSENEYKDRDIEFIIMIKAFDQSFSQTVYSRSSYKANEIHWGEKFVYLMKHDHDGIFVDVSRLDETEKTELNVLGK